jgi:hypothetical protein
MRRESQGLAAGLTLRASSELLMHRLRGGASLEDDNIVFDPTRMASVGIGLSKDKLGNHVVAKLTPGWPAALSELVQVKDIVLEARFARPTQQSIERGS